MGNERSGNWGHAGRPTLVGGSASGGGLPESKNVGYGHRLKGHTSVENYRIKQGVPKSVRDRSHSMESTVTAYNDLNEMKVEPVKCDRASIPKNQNERQGNCFQLSAQFQMDNPDWVVTHATLYPRLGNFADKIYFHSYNEKDGVIFDPVFNEFYDSGKYEKYYSTTDKRSYTQKQSMKHMLKTGQYGPWQ